MASSRQDQLPSQDLLHVESRNGRSPRQAALRELPSRGAKSCKKIDSTIPFPPPQLEYNPSTRAGAVLPRISPNVTLAKGKCTKGNEQQQKRKEKKEDNNPKRGTVDEAVDKEKMKKKRAKLFSASSQCATEPSSSSGHAQPPAPRCAPRALPNAAPCAHATFERPGCCALASWRRCRWDHQ